MDAEELREIAEQLKESGSGFKTFEEWFTHIRNYSARLKEQAARRQAREDAVTLSTMHSAKGACSSEIIVDDGPEEADGLADSGRRDRFGESGPERSASGRVPDVSDEAERLKKAEELYRQGLITYEEYQKKREEIIKSI